MPYWRKSTPKQCVLKSRRQLWQVKIGCRAAGTNSWEWQKDGMPYNANARQNIEKARQQ